VKALMLIISLCAALAFAGCGGSDDSSTSTPSAESTATTSEPTKPKVTIPKGAPPKTLEKKELVKGTGPEAKPGDEVTVQYVGVDYKTGEQFDASWDRGEPFSFTLGAGEVIPGWDKGIPGMKVGGRRELIIPPELAYGAEGSPPTIAPNSTLVFVVDLLGVN
jgi:peptidylprolyl isomerase